MNIYELILNSIPPLAAVVIFTAILINFLEAKYSGQVARERRSPVATGSMIGFFVLIYALIHWHVWDVRWPEMARLPLMTLGGALVILGAIANVLGRLRLGRNWANQATVYEGQTLVTRGIYGVVRHPLYASLIWIFFGAGLIYESPAALIANAFIFLPAMYYRAGLEEKLLEERFPEYAAYRRRVGTFFPKLIGGRHESV